MVSYILHLARLPRLCMITYSLQEDYMFFPYEPCQMIIKVIFISSFISGQHGLVPYAQCITCITLCSCTFTSHPFHLPCFRLSEPLFLHCISAACTENTVTLFCAGKKRNTTAPKHLPAKHPSPRAIMIAQKTAFNAALMTHWQRKKGTHL